MITWLRGKKTYITAIALAIWGVIDSAEDPSDWAGWGKIGIAVLFAIWRSFSDTPGPLAGKVRTP